jgi:aryl-alcohol dehydrogenase-like predicted oxidoreductase
MRGSPTDPLDMSSRPVEQRCHDVLDAAHAAGIRYVDPARLSRAAVTIGSKWGYSYIAGAATVDQLTSNLSGVAFAASSTELPSMATPPDEYWAHRRTLVWK